MENLLSKIQNLPEPKRKIIFWIVIVILGLVLLSFYINNAQKKLKWVELGEIKEKLQLPSFKEEFKKLPKIEIPNIEIPKNYQEKLRELEQTVKETKN